jgi:hypothetical protein
MFVEAILCRKLIKNIIFNLMIVMNHAGKYVKFGMEIHHTHMCEGVSKSLQTGHLQ